LLPETDTGMYKFEFPFSILKTDVEKVIAIDLFPDEVNVSNDDVQLVHRFCEILLSEIDRIRSIYIKQYEKYLKKLENIDFLEKLNFLYNELEIKQLRISKNFELNYDYDMNVGKSR